MPRLIILFALVLAAAAVQAASVQNLAPKQLSFTENQGQWDERVLFRADAGSAYIWLTADGVYYQFIRGVPDSDGSDALIDDAFRFSEPVHSRASEQLVVSANFVGANPSPRLVGEDQLEYRCNYFLGNDPEKWRTNVPNYRMVRFEDVYPGIDLKFYWKNRQLEYDFILSPGADPSQIAVRYNGIESMNVTESGQLCIGTKWGMLTEDTPYVFQVDEFGQTAVRSDFVQISDDTYGFLPAEGYNLELALVIDPVILYSTYLGGSADETAFDVAVDEDGDIYVVGWTTSTDFPAVNPYQQTISYDEAFVTRIDALTGQAAFSTYLGGEGADNGCVIEVASDGRVFICGTTGSNDFPMVDAYQSVRPGNGDLFISILSNLGDQLLFSTFLGGSDGEMSPDMAVDEAGYVYLTGHTNSSDYPRVSAFQTTRTGAWCAFVTKLNTATSTLVYSTYLGGSGNEFQMAIDVDDAGCAYVAGETESTDFPTQIPFQADQPGVDGFVTKLSAQGSSLVYSTYLGGDGGDNVQAIEVGESGAAYVAGVTQSSNFPVVNAYQPTHHGGLNDIFVAKVSPSGQELEYSTYLGGSDSETPTGLSIALVADGSVLLGSTSESFDFPTANAFDNSLSGGRDGVVARLSADGSRLIHSSFLGGSATYDHVYGIASGADGLGYVVGTTQSTDFPTVDPYQPSFAGSRDAFVVKLLFADPPAVVSTTPVQNALNIATNTDISVTFDVEMDETTINGTTFLVRGAYTGQYQGTISYFPGTRTATFDSDVDFKVGEVVTATLTAGMQSLDLVALDRPAVWSFTVEAPAGSAFLLDPTTFGVGDRPSSIVTADFNGDGYLDLATANYSGSNISVMLNSGDGSFSLASSPSTDTDPRWVIATDLNRDGHLDLVTANELSSTVSVLLGEGSGSFGLHVEYGVGGGARSVTAADFDGDGDIDLATSSYTGNSISVLINDGSGAFAPRSDFAVNGDALFITSADLDSDWDIDIATADHFSHTVSVLLNNGDGTFAGLATLPVGANSCDVSCGDLNADGTIDLISADEASSQISVLLNNGNATFASAAPYPLCANVFQTRPGDLDGDGDLDIVTSNNNCANVSVLINSGDGTLSPRIDYAAASYAVSLCLADFDGDNDLDVAVAHHLANLIGIHLNGTCIDSDGDGFGDPDQIVNDCPDDNCPAVSNLSQTDTDSDGVGDACDACPGHDDLADNDLDGVADGCDQCPGFDDNVDTDSDNVADGCDLCQGHDDYADDDSDGVPDGCDICPGSNDNADDDSDGVPDGCDICPGSNDNADDDSDGVPDGCDLCEGHDDALDADSDGVPDGCDLCQGQDDYADIDLDVVPDACDNCPETDNPGQEDADGDGLGDACCCLDRVGDANASGEDEPSIGDIAGLVDHLFISRDPLPCLLEADVNQSGGTSVTTENITIGDIAELVNYLFITGPALGTLRDCL